MEENKVVEFNAENEEVNFDEEIFLLQAGYRDKDNVIHKEYTLREINGKDEEAVQKADVKNNASKVLTTLLTRCVTRIGTHTPKNVGGSKNWEGLIQSLLIQDQDLMLLNLRKISIGEEIELSHICPECKAKLKTFMNLDELEIKDFDNEFEFEFELPRGYRDKKGIIHKKGMMRRPCGLDREILMPLAKNNLAKANTVLLTRICKFEDMPIDEDVMSSLSLKDRNYLHDVLDKHQFGVLLEIPITCDNCGSEFMGSFNATNFI